MDDKAMGLLGLMRRAGAIQIGEDNTGETVRAGRARLLLLAADAPENAVQRAERFSYGRRVLTVPLDYTRGELGHALGVSGCTMAAVTDIGFADALMSALKLQQPEKYGELADIMRQRQQKALRRKREKSACKGGKRNARRRTDA